MDKTIIAAIIAAVSSSGLMSLIIFLIQRRDKKKEKEAEKDSAQTKLLFGLAHDKLLYLTDTYVRRGCITLKEKRNLEFLARPYFDLKGNGDCQIGYEACQKLEVVSDDVAEERWANLRRKEWGLDAKDE